MKHPKLKLKAPKYKDEVVLELSGDTNDADYVNDVISVTVDEYLLILPVIQHMTKPHLWEDWEDNARDHMENTLKMDEETQDQVIMILDNISLFGEDCIAHTLDLDAVYFESASDNIRYEVKGWN